MAAKKVLQNVFEGIMSRWRKCSSILFSVRSNAVKYGEPCDCERCAKIEKLHSYEKDSEKLDGFVTYGTTLSYPLRSRLFQHDYAYNGLMNNLSVKSTCTLFRDSIKLSRKMMRRS